MWWSAFCNCSSGRCRSWKVLFFFNYVDRAFCGEYACRSDSCSRYCGLHPNGQRLPPRNCNTADVGRRKVGRTIGHSFVHPRGDAHEQYGRNGAHFQVRLRAGGGTCEGGLYYVNILASVIFSGMSGSNTADVAGLGRVEIRAMIDAGYDRAYSAAITAASSIIGPIIPPSIILVVYAQIANVSTGKLFLAGVLPGCLMAFCLSLIVFSAVRAKPALAGTPVPRASFKEFLISARDGFFALVSPAIIVGGMTLGIVTPSEAGVLAVFYSMLLGFIYKTLTLKVLFQSAREAAFFSGAILFVIAASGPFGWAINIMEVPETIGSAIQGVTQSTWVALIFINVGLLLLGALEAGSAALIIVAPVLIHLGRLYGIDPVQLGIIAAVNLTMGSLTPPVALSLFISAQIAEVPMKRAIVASIPFFLALITSLLLITYLPAFSLMLPNFLMGE